MAKKDALRKQAEQLGINPKLVEPPEGQKPERLRPTRTQENAKKFAVQAAQIMSEDKCEDIVVLDLRGISPICDYFVIATGTSDRQMRAVTDHIKDMAKKRDEKPYGIDGYEEGVWIVMDYVDVIIHLFDGERRGYYDLDSLWGDSPSVDWE